MGYQPRLTKEILIKLKEGEYDIKVEEARDSYSRLISIVKFLRERKIKFKNSSCIDVGCNDGIFANTLAEFGMDVVGVENDNIVAAGYMKDRPIDTANKTAKELNICGATFCKYDVINFFNQSKEVYDYSLVLSIMHNLYLSKIFRKDNPTTVEQIHDTFNKIWKCTNEIMFFENDDNFPQVNIDSFKSLLGDAKIILLSTHKAYNGDRKLYAIIKDSRDKIQSHVKTYNLEIFKGSGTEGFFITAHEKYFLDIMNYDEIFKGSLNLRTKFPLTFNKSIFSANVNYDGKNFNLGKCKVNGISGYIMQNAGRLEFFSNKEVVLEKGKLVKLELNVNE